MAQYRTSDGKVFNDIDKAVIHDACICYKKYGEFGHSEYIEQSEDGGNTWN